MTGIPQSYSFFKSQSPGNPCSDAALNMFLTFMPSHIVGVSSRPTLFMKDCYYVIDPYFLGWQDLSPMTGWVSHLTIC